MTRKRLEIGISNFRKIVVDNNYFVDKTELIYDWMSESAYVSPMLRPKRFGKTLNLSMIEHFFGIRKSDSAVLFQEFKISEKKDFCRKHQNKYPVTVMRVGRESIFSEWNNFDVYGITMPYFADSFEFTESETLKFLSYFGLLTILADDFMIKSNRKSGEGHYDILLIPHDKTKKGVVIEIKTIEKQKEAEGDDKFKARINNSIENVLRQIERNEYYKELIVNKIDAEDIVKLAIVFAGKEPYVNPIK